MTLDATDRKLLDLLQTDFPVTTTPWDDIAGVLSIPTEDVLSRVKRMEEDGVLRRVGAVIDARSLGFTSCLLAMQVPEERMEEVAKVISACKGVTHNYERDDTYNLWFTLTAESEAARDEQIRRWEEALGLHVLFFPGEKTYKRRVQFTMERKGDAS